MKRWAAITVGLYLLALLALTGPVVAAAFSWGDGRRLFQESGYWIWIGVSVAGQALLLVEPVVKAENRPVRRRHILTPIITSAFLLGLMCVGIVTAVVVAIWGDDGSKMYEIVGKDDYRPLWVFAAYVVTAWGVWAAVFWRFLKQTEPTVSSRPMKWLLAGSILELLVAVPSHVIVRHRADCCAPLATFWGIATGITVMLMAFGPGVFFLFVKRAQQLRPRSESHV